VPAGLLLLAQGALQRALPALPALPALRALHALRGVVPSASGLEMLAGRLVRALLGHWQPQAQRGRRHLGLRSPVQQPVAARLLGRWQAPVWGLVLVWLAPLRWLAQALAPAAWPQTDCAASQSQGLQWRRAPLARAYWGHGAPKVRGWPQPQAWRRARGLVLGHQASRARGWAFS
jgi:hypothetical protein